jgi:translation initiation factor 2 subunit 3
MDSESEHDNREGESASEAEEEIAEVAEPKSAMKKTREVLPPVERPELP